MKKIIPILFFIFTLSATAQTTVNDSSVIKIRKILEYQDNREGKEIEKFVSDRDKKVVLKAIYSLSNVHKTEIIPSLVKLLKDNDIEIKKAAAFSLGQTAANTIAVQDLINELKTAEDISYRSVLFESIGLIGAEEHLNAFLLMPVLDPKEDIGKIWGVTRFALRGIKNRNSVMFLLEKLKSNDDEIKLRAAYALWKSATISSITKEDIPIILNYVKQSESSARIYLLNTLGPLAANDSIKQIVFESINNNPNVQLSAFKVLGKQRLSKSDFENILNLNITDEHANLERIRILYKAYYIDSTDKPFVVGKIRELLNNKNYSWRERAELFIGIAILEGDNSLPILIKESASKNERYAAKIIKGISGINTKAAMKTLLYKIQTKGIITSISHIESISEMRKLVIVDSTDIRQARKIFVKAINNKNASLTTTVATSIYNIELIDLVPVPELLKAYNKFKYPTDRDYILEFVKLFRNYSDPEVIALLEKEVNSESVIIANEALTSLEDLSNKTYVRKNKNDVEPKKTFYDWDYYDKLCADPIIEINTEKGKIRIQLLPNDAPFTSISISKLIDRKYFDGLIFHRVVSNFVIQGGDPEGTGLGGPGYSIRTEISPLKFGTGFVGMASSGRDTEGSQFFITHSPQPHLDGRYTIFGKVIDGMDTVNKIQEGDKIISIRRTK